MKVKLDPYAYPPTRAHQTDAGLDIRAANGAVIRPGESSTFHTGVHVELPQGTCGLLVSKSGLNTKHGITSTGLIDEGYNGEIVIKLYNQSDTAYEVKPGDKISQLVIIPCLYTPVEIVDDISGGERGMNGFGSSGK
jgi:dUTP pyrophosphatase